MSLSDKSRGRPQDNEKQNAFDKLCTFLYENDECQYSIAELEKKVNEECSHAYSRKDLKEKLLKTFGDNITELTGKDGVVLFSDTAEKIIHSKRYTDKACDVKAERKRIVETAAAIVREDVRSYISDGDIYPSVTSLEETAEEMVLETLKSFVDIVIQPRKRRNKTMNRKSTAIQHAIMAASCPRSFVSPILLSVAMYIHRKYGHKDLINILHNIGLAESYTEVLTRIKEHISASVIGSYGEVPIRTYKKQTTPGLQQPKIKSLSLSPDQASGTLMKAMKLDSLWIDWLCNGDYNKAILG